MTKKNLLFSFRHGRVQQKTNFTVMFLVSKPLIWSEAEGDLVVIETSI